MSAVTNRDAVRGVDAGAHVVVAVRHLREPLPHVPTRDAARQRPDALPTLRDGRDQFLQQRELAVAVPLFRVEDAIGQFVELRRGVALAGGDGLLAPITLRHLAGLAAADLDVPAKNARIAHLERRYLGLL